MKKEEKVKTIKVIPRKNRTIEFYLGRQFFRVEPRKPEDVPADIFEKDPSLKKNLAELTEKRVKKEG
jgi:hypothetical protein